MVAKGDGRWGEGWIGSLVLADANYYIENGKTQNINLYVVFCYEVRSTDARFLININMCKNRSVVEI